MKVKKIDINFKRALKFLIPSLVGILLLMTPFKMDDGSTTVAVSVISDYINKGINFFIPIHILALIMIFISSLLALIYRFFKADFIKKSPILKEIADIGDFWILVRVIGLIIAVLTTFKIGPTLIYSEDTGGLILYELIGGLMTIFLAAGFILPFLTDFGILEFVGVFLSKLMRPVFKLPGRSAVDCIASWIGDGTIGVTLTAKQYEDGNYSQKEASIIATNFSAVSITFCMVVLGNIGMVNRFGLFYLVVGIAGIVAALIIPRIPPLSRKKDVKFKEQKSKDEETIPDNFTRLEWACQLAILKAESNLSISKFLKNGLSTVLSLWLGVTPVIMAAGTLALILSESTPVFSYLGLPFLPILKILGLPEASAASETMVIGFADMVVPSILAAESISSDITKFVVAAVSVSQLIYMSETGAVILGSSIPVSLKEIFIIFIERTLISLPIIVILTRLLF